LSLIEKWNPTKFRDWSSFRMKLRVRIARGRSYASVLVTPQRKTSLCEALQGRAAMAGVGAPWAGHGELAGEERGGGRGLGASWGEEGLQEGHRACSLLLACSLLGACWTCSLLYVRRKKERRKEKEGKEKRKKRKKYGNFSILKNFQGEK
jgi:hypothetical protein